MYSASRTAGRLRFTAARAIRAGYELARSPSPSKWGNACEWTGPKKCGIQSGSTLKKTKTAHLLFECWSSTLIGMSPCKSQALDRDRRTAIAIRLSGVIWTMSRHEGDGLAQFSQTCDRMVLSLKFR